MSRGYEYSSEVDADTKKKIIKKRLYMWDKFFERVEEKISNTTDDGSDEEDISFGAYSDDPKFQSNHEEHCKVRESLLKEHGISKDEFSVLKDSEDILYDTDSEGDCPDTSTCHKEHGKQSSTRDIATESERDSDEDSTGSFDIECDATSFIDKKIENEIILSKNFHLQNFPLKGKHVDNDSIICKEQLSEQNAEQIKEAEIDNLKTVKDLTERGENKNCSNTVSQENQNDSKLSAPSMLGTPKTLKSMICCNKTENTPDLQFVLGTKSQQSLPEKINSQKREESKNCNKNVDLNTTRDRFRDLQSSKGCFGVKDQRHVSEVNVTKRSDKSNSTGHCSERPKSHKTCVLDLSNSNPIHVQDEISPKGSSDTMLVRKTDVTKMYDEYEQWKLQKRRQSGQRGSLHIVSNLDEEPSDANKYVRLSSPATKPVLTPRRFSLKKPVY